jgi:uncharacterized protein (TIGR02147 family)
MNIFDYKDHLKFLQKWIQFQPKGGYGIAKKMAEAIDISTVLMSQILNGTREMTVEQSFKITEFLQLNEIEQKYFLILVQKARAGYAQLKAHYEKEARLIKESAQEIKTRIPKGAELSSEAQAEFYSHWTYSAVRLLTSIPKYQTPEALSLYLDLPRPEILKILKFLCQNGLCIEKSGRFMMGSQRTHIDASSPYTTNRQVQWRLKGFERMNGKHQQDLFYTAPLTVSEKDLEKIRGLLLNFVQDLTKLVGESGAEEIACVNFDFFRLKA